MQAEILVVDNCSQDGSRSFFEGRFPTIKFIWHTSNIGFSAANNMALKQATGEKVLFLNPDTILPEDCLTKCLYFFDKQQNIGATGIRMVDGSGVFLKESKRGFPSPLTSFFKLTGLASAFPASPLFARYYLGHLPDHTSNEAAVLSGAFILISKRVLEITGGFDEAFFMYGEDIDLSYRIQKAGFKNFYFAGSTIIHFKGESTVKNSEAYITTFYGAMELFVKKHHTNSSAFFYRALLHLTIFVKKITIKLRRKPATPAIKKDDSITLIVAGSNEYGYIKKALRTNGLLMDSIQRVTANPQDDAVSTIAALPEFCSQQIVAQIVFCNDELSIADIIKTIQLLPDTIQFSYHLTGTKSIISSNDKNTSGFWIALE